MSAEAAAAPRDTAGILAAAPDPRVRRVFRYAVGSTLGMAVAMGFDWQLSYLVPVLALSFFASPAPCPSLKMGIGFVAVVAVAVMAGVLLSRWLLPFPLVYVPFIGLALFRLFHAKTGGTSPLLIMWLLIALLVIPLVTMLSPDVAGIVAQAIVVGAAATVALVWFTYLLFPDPTAPTSPPQGPATEESPATSAAPAVPSPAERFRSAAETTAVVMPVLVLFYTLQLTSSLLILIFVALLSSQPGFADSFKAGAALIMGNVIGGIASIVFYELLVLVPEFWFLILLTLLTGLAFGGLLFSERKLAPLFGMGFSTVLLIIGSTTSGNAEAGSKVYTRVIQIMIAVTYVVVAFGLIRRFRQRREV
jgi:hypothetical protein